MPLSYNSLDPCYLIFFIWLPYLHHITIPYLIHYLREPVALQMRYILLLIAFPYTLIAYSYSRNNESHSSPKQSLRLYIKYCDPASSQIYLASQAFFLNIIEVNYNIDPSLTLDQKKSPFRCVCSSIYLCILVHSLYGTMSPPLIPLSRYRVVNISSFFTSLYLYYRLLFRFNGIVAGEMHGAALY
jgi:hypothetical protein